MGSIAKSIAKRMVGVLVACVLLAGVGVAPAGAVEPWWSLSSSLRPSTLAAGGEGTIVAMAVNVGDLQTSGPITFTDTLPAGVTAQGVYFTDSQFEIANFAEIFEEACEVLPGRVRCVYPGEILPVLQPFETLEMRIAVRVGAEAGGENHVQISQGGAPPASQARSLSLGGGVVSFGVDDFAVSPEEEDGQVDVQAGSHPFQLTNTFALNQTGDLAKPPALLRDLTSQLPAGLVGNATVIPQCSEHDFTSFSELLGNFCPDDTVVGAVVLTVDEPSHLGLTSGRVPLFNLVPSRGEPARFGFEYVHTLVTFDAGVRTGGDYSITVGSHDISQLANTIHAHVVFWGVPGDPRHDQQRGWDCIAGGFWVHYEKPCIPLNNANPAPLLSMPTACELPFTARVESDSWPLKGAPEGLRGPVREYTLLDNLGRQVGLAGCDQLPFAPSLRMTGDTGAASTPTGLTVDVHMPQDAASNPNGLAASALRDTTVTLPEGVQINPASADGLAACSEAQVGFTGMEGERALFTPGPASCPDASKVGTVDEITTPLLPNPLTGSVYVAAQGQNPFGSLLALYIVAEDPVSGVLVKLAGNVQLDPVTGRLTATFKETPQQPFEDLKLHFFGGSRAPLSTPPACGSYAASGVFTPWSGTSPVESTADLVVTSGPNGSACPAGVPFAPSLTAGMTNIQAGGFSPFTLTVGRPDGQQALSGVQLHMPPGLLGMLSSVTPCAEPQASLGTCGPASLIGHTTVSAGVGSDPFTISGGQVFITGPYKGAPFGLSIAVPAKAGPFDIGSGPCDCVVVRARLDVDPHTAQITVTSDPLPTILQGIPLQIQHVNVTVDRSGFTFNPTSCDPMSLSGTLTGELGGSASATVPFQVTNCQSLGFHPSFKVSTQAKTSKKQGASLDVKVASGPGQANIGKVAVTLPKQLPSRLTTIQQACPEAAFNANPASCPAGSNIGTAVAHTPVLANPVTGPAYLVSHGGAAFPDLVLILQGEGVKLELVGSIDIKHGVTSSAFNSVPDAPISTFELSLPEGPHSALAATLPAKAKGNLCGTALTMPTTITGQNNAQVKQQTKIAVTGCGKAKPKKKARKHRPKKGRKKKG